VFDFYATEDGQGSNDDLPDRGVVGSELVGDPLETDPCDGVLVPSIESARDTF